MAFDWRDYLELADELSTSGDEARLRSAVSRAYYAAYHRARVVAERRYQFTASAGANKHDQLWKFLKQDGKVQSPRERAAGEDGLNLRDMRAQADYDAVKSEVWKRKADHAIRLAKKVIEAVQGPTS